MKKSIARMLCILPATLVVFAGPVTPAEANTHMHVQADGCKNFNANEIQDIDMLVSGVRNIASTERTVICNVPRLSNSPAGSTEAYSYRVYGSNSSSQSTTCNVTAFDSNGNVRAQASFTTTSASYYSNALILSGAAVLAGDTIALVCTLPKNGLGVLRGYSAIQSN